MANFGLIGYPLSNKRSEQFFAQKFDEKGWHHTYVNFPVETLDNLISLVEQHKLSGFNVTIPHKVAIIPFLHELDPEAAQAGAVNTVKVTNRGWIGYNTDIEGFRASLVPLLHMSVMRAMVFGTGGASRAVQHVLHTLRIPFVVVSRNRKDSLTYTDITPDLLKQHQLLINATPLGMGMYEDQCPDIPYDAIGSEHLAYDLVYRPSITRFMREAGSRGATMVNGEEMLRIQAEKALELWLK